MASAKITIGKVFRVLASLLIASHAFLTLSLPQTANAFSGGGAGSSGNPYRITSCSQLSEMSQSTDYFLLRNDLDCDSTELSPIHEFQGTFDGRNHSIINITISSAGDNIGLFSTLTNATIKNLTIANSSFSGRNYVGSLAGIAGEGVAISHVSASGGNVSGATAVGGLIGQTYLGATIETSSFNGLFNASVAHGGGITGYLADGSSINNSYAHVTGTGTSSIGGIAGTVVGGNPATSINRSYVVGSINTASSDQATNRGGLIGLTMYGGSGTSAAFRYNVILVDAHGGSALSGSILLGTLTVASNYYDATLLGFSTNRCMGSTNNGSCTAINTDGTDGDHFKDTDSATPFNNWDFETIWQTTNDYPVLRTATLDELDPAVAPNEVSNLQATPGDGAVELSWEAPVEDGGAEITDYQVHYRLNGESEWTETNTASNTPHAVISDLSNGAYYDFRVAATNSAGTSPYVVLENQVIGLPPGTVLDLWAGDNDGQAAVSWLAPDDSGSGAITGYHLSYRPHGESDWGESSLLDAETTSSIVDVPSADFYDFRVRAISDIGASEWSEVSNILIGTIEYTISTCQDLQAIQDDPAGHYTLADNIDCSETNQWNEDGEGGYTGFMPIEDFSGTLEGGDYTISGLYIDRVHSCYQGLFSDLESGATVQNVILENVYVRAQCESGPIAGIMFGDTTISNVEVNGTVSVDSDSGGIVGTIDSFSDGDVSITGSVSSVSLVSNGDNIQSYVGGIVGYVSAYDSTITLTDNQVWIELDNQQEGSHQLGGVAGGISLQDSSNFMIDGTDVENFLRGSGYVGGLIGGVASNWYDEGSRPSLLINDARVDLSIYGKSDIGGLIGSIAASALDTSIENSSFVGYAESTQSATLGGFIGNLTNSSYDPTFSIQRSYANAELMGSEYVGGLVGYAEIEASIDNSYFDGTITGTSRLGGLVAGGHVAINHSYAVGLIDSEEGTRLGGLVGHMTNGSIDNSFAAMELYSSDSAAGGVVGMLDDGSVNAWIDASIVGNSQCNTELGESDTISYSCTPVNEDDSNPEYFQDQSNQPLDTWDFENTWYMPGDYYPQLQGDTQEDTEYEISTCEELQNINDDLTGSYLLVNDIDCSGSAEWNDGQGFLPIGTDSGEGFTGTLEGQGYAIRNLTINRPESSYAGLFAATTNAYIASFTMINAQVSGGYVAGSVAAIIINSIMLDVHGRGSTITAASVAFEGISAAGGLVGFVTANNSGMYGVAGSSFKGTVEGMINVGGLVGAISANLIFDSYANATVTGGTNVGGFIGTANMVLIQNTYSAGSVTATGGGELGSWAGGHIGVVDSINIASSFSVASVTVPEGSEALGNGFIGSNAQENVAYSNNFYSTNNGSGECTLGFIDPIVDEDCTPIDLNENPNYFKGNNDVEPLSSWDFENTWATVEGNLPVLATQRNTMPIYQITNCSQLQGMQNDLAGDYVLQNDIDCSETVDWTNGDGFMPIGNSDESFTGTFDGQGYAITGLSINRTDLATVGLFGSADHATVENFTLRSPRITGGSVAGSILGSGYETIISHVQVVDGEVATTPDGESATGGLAGVYDGESEGATTIASSFEGSVLGTTNVGGLIGFFADGTLYNTYADALVGGDDAIGGLAGYSNSGDVYYSYAAGEVTLTGNVEDAIAGGLVGSAGVITLYNSFAAAHVTGRALIGTILEPDDILIASLYYDMAKDHDGNCGDITDNANCIGIDTEEQPDYFFNPENAPLSGWSFGATPWVAHMAPGLERYPDFGGTPLYGGVNVEVTSSSITSLWEYPDNNGSAITGYELRYKEHLTDDEYTIVNLNGDTTEFTASNLKASTFYQFGIRATNSRGTSDWYGYVTDTEGNTSSQPRSSSSAATSTLADALTTLATTSATGSAPIIVNDQAKTILDDFPEYAQGGNVELQLKVGQVIYFYVGNELHSATVKEIGNDYIILTIASTPFDVRISVGETKEVSVNQNNVKDVSITLTSIQNGTANISFARLTAPKGPAANTKAGADYGQLWLLLLLIPAGLYLARHRKKS